MIGPGMDMEEQDLIDPDGISEIKRTRKKKKNRIRGMRRKRYKRTMFVGIILGLAILIIIAPLVVQNMNGGGSSSLGPSPGEAQIFFNEACGGCVPYIDNDLVPAIKASGIAKVKMLDYVNDKANRRHLNSLNEQYGVPDQLLGHIATFINTGDLVILMGHAPIHVVNELIANSSLGPMDKILVLQDKMEGADNYGVWGFKGNIKYYQLDKPVEQYITWFGENKDSLITPDYLNPREQDPWPLIGIVIVTGLIDGINPCAFAVLLLFISFLFSIGKLRVGIFAMGTVYIMAIYTVYFLIGLGLLQAVHFFGITHFMALAGAIIVIILGFINLRDYLFPNLPIHLEIPYFTRKKIQERLHKATLPAALVAGSLVGLCTFPCSGGIYVAIVGLLATEASFSQGVLFLLLYNMMFVVPLIAILAGSSNKYMTNKMKEWEESKSKKMRIMMGFTMIILGMVILIWFVNM